MEKGDKMPQSSSCYHYNPSLTLIGGINKILLRYLHLSSHLSDDLRSQKASLLLIQEVFTTTI